MHHSSTSTYIPNFIEIEETFCGRTDVRTDGRTYGRTFPPPLILLGRLLEVDLKKSGSTDVNKTKYYKVKAEVKAKGFEATAEA